MKKVLLGLLIALLVIIGILVAIRVFSPKPSVQPILEPNETSPSPIIVDVDSTMLLDTSLLMEEDTLKTMMEVNPAEEAQQMSVEETNKEEPVTETEVEQASVTEPVASVENTQFRQAFWDLIHHQERQMDAYGNLFRDYKGKVECEEFDYLRGYILISAPGFKEWATKLGRIPSEDIQSINTVNDLKSKLRKIE